MKTLLTGARGFTGPYVRAELERAGHTVVGAVFDAALEANEVALDISDLASCRAVIDRERPDVIVHLAGIAATQEVRAEPYYSVNVIGTENLLRACWDVDHMPRKILLVSSATVYGVPVEGQLEIDETAPLRPVNHYAISKLAMELMARAWFERLPILIVRPFNYIGRGQAPSFVTAKIVDHFRRRSPVIELGNLDVARDFSDVRDVAETYAQLIDHKSAVGDIINVCSGRAFSLQYVIDTLQEITGHGIDVRINPAFVRINDPKSVRGSTRRLDQLIGVRHLSELNSTLEWMVEPMMLKPRLTPAGALA
jgi:nucleoside-diphosphate-sugar epimerase